MLNAAQFHDFGFVFENLQRRRSDHTGGLRNLGFGFDVNFDDVNPIAKFTQDFIQDWLEHVAGAAGRCDVSDDDRAIGLVVELA